jgi:hypothetical protein
MEAAPGLSHTRELRRLRAGRWELTDRLHGDGTHTLAWHFHFAPDLRLTTLASEVRVEDETGPYVILTAPPGVQISLAQGEYSARYGEKVPNPLLVASWQGPIPPTGLEFGWIFQHVAREDQN